MKNFVLLLIVACLGLVRETRADILGGPDLAASSIQNPSSVDWAQLQTEHFRVIFPSAQETEARRVAGLLEAVYGPDSEGPKAAPSKLDVILQAHTLDSNGFVTLAPRRSEWFTVPFQGPDVGQTEWLRTLAAHEFRHVVQFEKSRTGFAKFLRYAFGEIGQAFAIGWTLPPWYLEGDAVGMETALSSGGRGRLPLFARDLRTIFLDGQDYSYEQLALGSYEHYIPNHYFVGYHLVSYLRRRFGREVLERMHYETMERAYNPLAFFNSLERVTQVDFDQAYQDCLEDLTKLWRAQEALIAQTPVESLSVKGTHGWTNFSYPSALSDAEGGVLAYREGLSHIGQFVRLRDNHDPELLWTPTPLLQDFPYKVRGDRFAYAERAFHPRWGMQDFSRVVVRKVDGETLYRSEVGNWMMPVLDQAARRLAVYDWSNSGSPSLKQVDLATGAVTSDVRWPREKVVMGMDWIPESDRMVVLHRDGAYGLVLSEVWPDGRVREIARSTKYNWAYPAASSTHVYFQSPASGIDNIHRISLKDGLEERLTSERFGAYHPSLSGEELVFARYTPEGLRPAHLSLAQTRPLPPGPDSFVAYYQPLVEQEGKGDVVAQTAPATVAKESYSLPEHALNGHSWTILGNYFGSVITPAIISTDVLNNLALMAGVGWNLNERTLQGYAGARWSHYYPIFDFKAAWGRRRELDLPVSVFGKREDTWEEGSSELGVTLPWRSVWGRFVNQASLRGSAGILHAHGRVYPDWGDLSNQTLSVPGAEANFSALSRMAPRDLMPRYGVSAQALWKEGHDISGRRLENSPQKFVVLRPFLPGAWWHHHLFGEVSHEEQNQNGYHFATPSLFSRGYAGRFMQKRTKTSVNYALPLWYPDWNLSRYFYLKRISLNLFHDNTWGDRYALHDARYESRGAELWFDSHFVRNAFPIQWGVRYSSPVRRGYTDSAELFLNLGVTTF